MRWFAQAGGGADIDERAHEVGPINFVSKIRVFFLATSHSYLSMIHDRSAHKMSVSDYKEEHGNHRTQIIEHVYHKCGLCGQVRAWTVLRCY